MPKVTDSKRLIELVKKSELVSSEVLTSFLADRSEAGNSIPAEPEPLAEDLVKANLLSNWQMDQILKGKYRGFRLGKYALQNHIGTGGMSTVYLSEHPIMRRPVAIKVLPKSRVSKSSYLERFELEARAVATLDHPNIVRAYDIDNDGDTHYIVMEYVEGMDLQRMVEQNGPLSYDQAADYIAQAASGLQHAHELGVVHRDVKPANCLVDPSGTLKLLDMGLVKFAKDDQSLSAVHKDSVVGTADYLAPEQAVNSSEVDARADIYGLGGTLYFLLTGHPPFPDGTLTERLLKHQKEEPASIFSVRADAPAALVDICRRMLVKNKDKRIQSAAIVEQELRGWLAGRTGSGNEPATSGLGRLSAYGKPKSGSNRWQDLLEQKKNAAPPKRREDTSDTISAGEGDTGRITGDEDLALAPLEEEDAIANDKKASTSSSDVSGDSDKLDNQVLSQIESEIGQHSSTSGSLVDLLQNPALSSVNTSNVVLKRKSKTSLTTWLAVGAVIVFSIIGGAIAISMVLN